MAHPRRRALRHATFTSAPGAPRGRGAGARGGALGARGVRGARRKVYYGRLSAVRGAANVLLSYAHCFSARLRGLGWTSLQDFRLLPSSTADGLPRARFVVCINSIGSLIKSAVGGANIFVASTHSYPDNQLCVVYFLGTRSVIWHPISLPWSNVHANTWTHVGRPSSNFSFSHVHLDPTGKFRLTSTVLFGNCLGATRKTLGPFDLTM